MTAARTKKSTTLKPTQQRILAAAKELFLRHGYSNTNLEDVAEAAGVTKPTVYSHFGSKEGLLLSMTEHHTSENADRLSDALMPSGDIESDLMAFGAIFYERTQNHEATSWHRLAIAESANHPEIGDALFASGPAKVLRALGHFIKAETKAGRLECKDAELAAEQFLGLLLGINPIRAMTGQSLPGPAKRKRICRQAVNTFLAAYATKKLRAKS
ncbi:MAG: TetR/AcrR family transcriptional regulator [Planctomycetota bacterium]